MREKFLADLQRRNYSPLTVKAYASTLGRLERHLGQPCTAATTSTIRGFLATQSNISNGSKARHLAALKSFALFLRKIGYACPLADVRGVRSPKVQRTLPRPLSEAQAAGVMDLASRRSNHLSAEEVARNKVVMLLLYGAGLRASEALSLPASMEVKDSMFVIGKGQKERLVPLLPVVQEALRAYQETLEDKSGLLFRGFTDRALRDLMASYREKLDLPKSATPHALRHSFATHLHQNGADLMVLKDLLGHASVSTTAIYTKVDKISLLKTLEGCYEGRYVAAKAAA